MTVIGEYHREGYRVINAATGESLFVEGNSPGGGDVVLDPFNRYALPMHTLRSKCETKAKEIASACGATFGGVERTDD